MKIFILGLDTLVHKLCALTKMHKTWDTVRRKRRRQTAERGTPQSTGLSSVFPAIANPTPLDEFYIILFRRSVKNNVSGCFRFLSSPHLPDDGDRSLKPWMTLPNGQGWGSVLEEIPQHPLGAIKLLCPNLACWQSFHKQTQGAWLFSIPQQWASWISIQF